MRKVILLFCFFFAVLEAVDQSPSCYRALQTHFFDDAVAIQQALNMNGIPESGWAPILNELQSRSREVPAIVKARAQGMRPNPLFRPFNSEEAERILEQVLYEIFYETVHPYDIKNIGNMRQAFAYIKQQQIARWEGCFEKER